MSGLQEDDGRLEPVVAQIGSAESANAEAFDKAIMTLSSGALALSFAFVKDIVSPAFSRDNWLLYTSWVLFVLALVVNVTGFMFALRGFRNQWYMAFKVFRHREVSEDQLQSMMENHRDALYRINVWQGWCFIGGVIAFAAYVMTNFYLEAQMAKLSGNNTFGKAQPSAAFVPLNSKPVIVGDSVPSAAYVPSKPQAAAPAPPAPASSPKPAAPTGGSSTANLSNPFK
jgi:hypothetical protein